MCVCVCRCACISFTHLISVICYLSCALCFIVCFNVTANKIALFILMGIINIDRLIPILPEFSCGFIGVGG